jgi:2OG-Fe(II) oxygenase superfamily
MSDMEASSSSSKPPPSIPSSSKAPPLAVAELPEPLEAPTYEAWAAHTTALVGNLYDGISAPFCCGGTLHVPRPVQVTTVQDQVTYTLQPPPTLFQGKEDADVDVDAAKNMVKLQAELLRDFVESAPPAVFGKGFEEAYDKTVRDGKQWPADAFTTNIDPDLLKDVLRQIQVDLGLRVGIQAEPYSINMYEEGGLFESHKDTPRGKDMFGTLVLCLPSLFVGGALQVGMTHGTTTSYFGKHLDQSQIPFEENLSGDPTWWRVDGAAESPVAIPWCAFFSDADHRVCPVRKGVRVALTYLLRRSDGAPHADLAPRALEEEEDQLSALAAAFQAIKANAFKPDVRVAFPCDHLYTTSEVFADRGPDWEAYCDEGTEKYLNRVSPATAGRLKGRDALVARAANRAGLQVFLLPFLSSWEATSPDRRRGDDHFIWQFEADNLGEIDDYQNTLESVFNPPAYQFYARDEADLWIKEHDEGRQKRMGAVGYVMGDHARLPFALVVGFHRAHHCLRPCSPPQQDARERPLRRQRVLPARRVADGAVPSV